jgi:hypothetical protein
MSRIVPTTPDNSLTPSYSSVPSSNGFSSGDLVYYKDSNFGVIPANAVPTGSFPVSATVYKGSEFTNATVQSVWTENSSPNGGNNIRAEIAATLTNGNIVVVMSEAVPSSGYPWFKIIDQNGTQVVAKSQVTSSQYPYNRGSISVCALTGGGFVVAFARQGGNYEIYYRVYDNSGVAVTSLTQDTGLLYSYNFSITSLANGGFVIASNTVPNGSGLSTRVYSSTGVQGTNVTGIGMYASGSYVPIVRSLPDNSFYVLAPLNSSQLYMYRFSTSGSYVGNYNVTPGSDWYTSAQYSMDVLANGTFAFMYVETGSGSYYGYGKIFDPTTNTVTYGTYVNTTYTLFNEIKAIPSGGFLMIGNNSPTYGGMNIYKCDNTFGVIASTISHAIPSITNNYVFAKYTLLIGATYYTIMWNGNFTSSTSAGTSAYIQVLPSDLSFRKTGSATTTVGTATANVNGYARSGSTPNSASFLAATTQTLSVSQPAITGTSFTLTPYVPFSDSITWQSMCTMNDGRFVIAYTSGSGGSGIVKFSVFNPDGTLYSTTTVVSGVDIGQGLIRCACLKNGKLVITYGNTSGEINIKIYSSTYSLLVTSGVYSQTGYPITNPDYYYNQAGHGLAPFNDDCFVIGFYSSSYGTMYVISFSDSGTYISIAGTGVSGTWYGVQVYAAPGGTIAMRAHYQSSSVSYTWTFAKGTSANTVAYSSQSYYNGLANADYYNTGGAISPTGIFYGPYNYSSNMYFERSYYGTGWRDLSITSFTNACMGDVAIGTDGMAVSIIMPNNNSNTNYIQTYSAALGSSPYGGAPQALSTTAFTATDKSTNSGNGPVARLTCLYDNTFAFSYITNSGSRLKVGLLNTVASTYTTGITAGTTVSQVALYPSPANGYYLAGVAASDCTAGGTGVIQTNGTTTLNSQYPSTTSSQAFDFTTNTLSGVRGTIAGRNVVLKGS